MKVFAQWYFQPQRIVLGIWRVGRSVQGHFQKKFSCTTSFETASQHWFRNSFRNDSSTYHFLSILWNITYTHYLHTNECNWWAQKHPKFSKILKNAQNSNLKPVLESVLVADFKSVLGFSCLAPEVPFFGYPKMPKINPLGTQKMVLLMLNTKNREQFRNQWPNLIPKLVFNSNFELF